MPISHQPPESGDRNGSIPAPLTPAGIAKIAVRDRILTARRRLPVAELGVAAQAVADVLAATPEVRRAATVAAYVGIGTEPGTGPLLEMLTASGKRVILPVLAPDGDLDWAAYDGDLAPARRGLLEPTGPALGREAIAGADVVVVPGLAVDDRGVRLGRGGGSYDRALGRVPVGTFTCILLHAGETGVAVPVEPHDRPVTAAATPAGLLRFGGG